MAKQPIKNEKNPPVFVKKTASTISKVKKPFLTFESQNKELLYDKTNYAIMGVAMLLIIVGFAFMAGGASKDPNVFDANAIYSFKRITLAPFLVILGFSVGIVAVLKKPAEK